MKYADSNVTGDAGEYYFAYFVTCTLGWPCRLLDIDIGIDAQIEILDDHSHSTGHFLAVQIKGTRDGEKLSLPVKKKHVDYWLSVDVPVLLSIVNVDSQLVYVKSVRLNGEAPLPNSKGVNYLFEFNASDLLSVSRANELRLLAYAPDVRRIEGLLESVKSKCSEVIDDCDMEDGVKVEDYHHYLQFISDMQHVGSELYKCKQLLLKIRDQVGGCGYEDTCKLFRKARSDMSYFFERASFHIHNSAEINAFNEDYFAKESNLELDG